MSRDNIGPNAIIRGWVTIYPDSNVLDMVVVSADAGQPINVRGSTISGRATIKNCHVINSIVGDNVLLWNGLVGESVLCGDVRITSFGKFMLESLYWWVNVP